MTKLQKNLADRVDEIARNGLNSLSGQARQDLISIARAYRNNADAVECLSATVSECLQPLAAAFHQYGCDPGMCNTPNCPRGMQCNAYYIHKAVMKMQECLMGVKHGETV